MNAEAARRPLADMVRERNDQWSYREMAERARRAGFSISHSQLADYAADGVRKPPDQQQVEAIAAALDLGFETVLAAVFEQWFGYVPRELKRTSKNSSRVSAVIPHGLSTEQEDELMRMIEAWAAAKLH